MGVNLRQLGEVEGGGERHTMAGQRSHQGGPSRREGEKWDFVGDTLRDVGTLYGIDSRISHSISQKIGLRVV